MTAVLSPGMGHLALLPGVLAALKISLGAATYTVTVLGLWWMAGRPPGAEAYLLKKCHAAWSAVRIWRPAN